MRLQHHRITLRTMMFSTRREGDSSSQPISRHCPRAVLSRSTQPASREAAPDPLAQPNRRRCWFAAQRISARRAPAFLLGSSAVAAAPSRRSSRGPVDQSCHCRRSPQPLRFHAAWKDLGNRHASSQALPPRRAVPSSAIPQSTTSATIRDLTEAQCFSCLIVANGSRK